MYGDAILVQQSDGAVRHARRLPLGQTDGRDEIWLQNLLFAAPDSIPIGDLDPSFGPLVPLCRQLRTEAGPVDIAFINADGLLTLIECKLWRNPEARRKVVAQILDYARAISRWTYADLQRQVSAATKRPGNIPYELARSQLPELEESRFVDAASRAMRTGRFQLLIAGDGIREDVGALAELINRNAASAFSFSMLEVALYGLDGALFIHPRVVAKTVNLERTVVVLRDGPSEPTLRDEEPGEAGLQERNGGSAFAERAHWWVPLQNIQFDDPEQEPAKFTWPNNFNTRMPLGLWVSAFRNKAKGGECGVFLGGKRSGQLATATKRLLADRVLDELPPGAYEGREGLGILLIRPEADFPTVADEQQWLAETLNQFANLLRPRLKSLSSEGRVVLTSY